MSGRPVGSQGLCGRQPVRVSAGVPQGNGDEYALDGCPGVLDLACFSLEQYLCVSFLVQVTKGKGRKVAADF